jgi:hypothetical protein
VSFTPPSWPDAVLPPGTPDWEQSAQAWLLDQCPPEYRGHVVLRRHHIVLAWLAYRHARASWEAMSGALATARAELAGVVEAEIIEASLTTIEQEQARLVGVGRAINLVLESLLGRQHVPRM